MMPQDSQGISPSATDLHLFEGFGVELEYMLVDQQSLNVRPMADQVMYQLTGEYSSEFELGDVAWSNELALHVIELKTNGPAGSLTPLPDLMQQHVRQLNTLLAAHDACLMPTAMHPWMDPWQELRLWPHDYSPVYESYHRIFDCRGHGWANLQSVHLNLPFADDAEFGRLHAAIRLLMPLLPAIAASSPVVERRLTGLQDNRMDVYRHNSRRVPSITADVVPEAVYTRADYERRILQRMYDDIAPLDPDAVLQHEWLNARGAIARFDRNTIELRVLDVQECPRADLAICALITEVLSALTSQRWTATTEQQAFPTEPLAELLQSTTRDADQTVIDHRQFLAQFGLTAQRLTAAEIWQHLLQTLIDPQGPWWEPLSTIARRGPLSRRIAAALKPDIEHHLHSVYQQLCDCLAHGRMF